MQYLTKAQREQLTLSEIQKEILVGLLLGDLYAQKCKGCVNARLEFLQGTLHKEYLLALYERFKDFSPATPKIQNPQPDKRTGKVYSTIRFYTYSLPCFNEYYDLFYLDGRKIVPHNIAELLTPRGLAFWIFDDGHWNKENRRVVLSTNSFTLVEVNLLADALNKNFDLKCYVNKHTSGYIIIIPPYSIPRLRTLLEPYMLPMMHYKIGV